MKTNELLAEGMVDVVANDIPTDEILEGLAMHILENNLDLNDVIADLKLAYNRDVKGRAENKKEEERLS